MSRDASHRRGDVGERNKMDGIEALGLAHIVEYRLKVSADKERKMSNYNYNVGWKASGLRMRPIDEDGD